MAKLTTYRDLLAWQLAMDLAANAYEWSSAIPKEHRYELTSQLRRSALSIPLNVAEGYGRRTRNEYLQFIGYARGSLRELESCILLALRLKLDDEAAELLSLCERVGQVLFRLDESLSRPHPKG